MRKKVSTNENAGSAVADLEENEELVFETTKRVRRERKTPEPVGDVITVEPEPPDGDDEDDQDEQEFSDTSLAAMIYGEGDEPPLENQFCTIVIRRNPDSMNDRFLTPNSGVMKLPALRNIELTTDVEDIEQRVRSEYGGGHYFFQLHFGNRLQRSWKSTLSDLPEAIARDKALKAAASQLPAVVASPAPPVPPPVSPIDTFLENSQKLRMLKEELFGEKETEYRTTIEELRTEVRRLAEKSAGPQSPELALVEKALSMNGNSELQNKLIDAAFPSNEGRSMVAELASVFMENGGKELLGGVVKGLLGVGSPAAPPPNTIEAFMQAHPPVPVGSQAASLPASGFRRNRPVAGTQAPPAAGTQAPLPASVREDADRPAGESSTPMVDALVEKIRNDPTVPKSDPGEVIADLTADSRLPTANEDAKPKRKRTAA